MQQKGAPVKGATNGPHQLFTSHHAWDTLQADRGARREAFPTLDDPRQVAEALLAHVLHLFRSRAGSQAVHTGCTGLWPGRALLRARIVGDACRFVSHLSTILRRCPVRLATLSRGPAGSLHRTQTISQAAMVSVAWYRSLSWKRAIGELWEGISADDAQIMCKATVNYSRDTIVN